MATVLISKEQVPALGDLRILGDGDTLCLQWGWKARRDAGRYADAIQAAVTRGANVVWAPKA